MIAFIDLELKETACEYDAANSLKKIKGVLGASVLSKGVLFVKYDSSQVTPAAIKDAAEAQPKRVINRQIAA